MNRTTSSSSVGSSSSRSRGKFTRTSTYTRKSKNILRLNPLSIYKTQHISSKMLPNQSINVQKKNCQPRHLPLLCDQKTQKLPLDKQRICHVTILNDTIDQDVTMLDNTDQDVTLLLDNTDNLDHVDDHTSPILLTSSSTVVFTSTSIDTMTIISNSNTCVPYCIDSNTDDVTTHTNNITTHTNNGIDLSVIQHNIIDPSITQDHIIDSSTTQTHPNNNVDNPEEMFPVKEAAKLDPSYLFGFLSLLHTSAQKVKKQKRNV